jgi:hypothetical protein
LENAVQLFVDFSLFGTTVSLLNQRRHVPLTVQEALAIFDANTVGPLKYIQAYNKYSSILSQQVILWGVNEHVSPGGREGIVTPLVTIVRKGIFPSSMCHILLAGVKEFHLYTFLSPAQKLPVI